MLHEILILLRHWERISDFKLNSKWMKWRCSMQSKYNMNAANQLYDEGWVRIRYIWWYGYPHVIIKNRRIHRYVCSAILQIHEIERILNSSVLKFSEFSYSVRIFILEFTKVPNFKVFIFLRWIWNTAQCNQNMLWVCITNY